MFKLLKIAAFALLVPVLALSGSAMVAAAGQIEGGNFYRAKNVTKGGNYGDPITADKCETVQFLVQIHNPGPEPLNNVRVSATLPNTAAASISSTATISSPDANPNSMSDTATINMPDAYSMNYVSGSTKLLNANAGVIQSLPDGVIGGGVSVPNGVGVSLQQIRYVQFQAKINCPTPPKECPPGTTGEYPDCKKPEKPKCPEGTTGKYPKCKTPEGKVVTPSEPTTPSTPSAPATIAATGPEAIVSGVVGSSALGYGVRRFLMSKAALKDALNK